MITPETLAKAGTESAHQQAVMCWAAMNTATHPELRWLHHIPNGGARGDDAKTRAIRGGKLKAEGVKEGVSDLCLPVKRGIYSGLYIEMKKPGGKPSKLQLEFGVFVTEQGFRFCIIDNWQDAVACLTRYLDMENSK